MTVAFQLPPMARRIDRQALEPDLCTIKPFFIDTPSADGNNSLADLFGVDMAHIHYPIKITNEAVRRVDFDFRDFRTRVTNVVSRAEVKSERAAGWWIDRSGNVMSWLHAAEEKYAMPTWRQDLAKISEFFTDLGLTQFGVRSLQRPEVHDDEIEVEYTDPATRTQVFGIVPRSSLSSPTWEGQQSVWRFVGEGPLSVTDCFNYCDDWSSHYPDHEEPERS